MFVVVRVEQDDVEGRKRQSPSMNGRGWGEEDEMRGSSWMASWMKSTAEMDGGLGGWIREQETLGSVECNWGSM